MTEYIVKVENLAKLRKLAGLHVKETLELTNGEVVRCRDCKFAYELDGYMLDCHGHLTELWDYWNDEPKDNPVEPDGFCAWGERGES